MNGTFERERVNDLIASPGVAAAPSGIGLVVKHSTTAVVHACDIFTYLGFERFKMNRPVKKVHTSETIKNCQRSGRRTSY